jgi:arabinose-5-phosphate isomerase
VKHVLAAAWAGKLDTFSVNAATEFALVDGDGRAIGIFTDGDLRRLIERGADLRALHAEDVMHRQPRCVSADALAVSAAEVMEQHRVTSVLAVDAEGRLVGALNTNDLMRAKVI